MSRIFRRTFLTALAVTAGVAPLAAQAATPYLMPTQFSTQANHTTVQAAQVMEAYFTPFSTLRGGSYTLLQPDGSTAAPTKVVELTDVTMIEAALPTVGTYRLTTGEWVTRTTKLVKIDGAWKTVRPAPPAGAPAPQPNPRFVEEANVPAGAETVTTQGLLTTDVYISRGAPNDTVLKPTGKGLELTPSHNPTDVFGGDSLTYRLTLDGKPLAGAHVAVHAAGNTYAGKVIFAEGDTDATGAYKLTYPPGVYSLQVAYPAPTAPDPTAAPVLKAYTYTTTFEVNP